MAQLGTQRPFPREIFEKLSKAECEGALEILHYIAQSETSEDVRGALVRFKNIFPFDCLLGGLAHISPEGTFAGFANVINVSYPDEWLYLYWKSGFAEVDPVFQTALQFPGTQHWKQTYQGMSTDKEMEFVSTARQFGLVDGITTGSVDQACRLATFCSFAGGEHLNPERYLRLVEYLGYHFHLALMRTAPTNVQLTDHCVNALTPREVTILNWMKTGKTNWEIGRILGVSERTIRFHVEGIFSKLDVTSRSQAVATAMEHGLPALHGLPTAS